MNGINLQYVDEDCLLECKRTFCTTNLYFYCKAATSSGHINSEGSQVTHGDKRRGRRSRCRMVKNNK